MTWFVFPPDDPNDDTTHVVPNFGKEHELEWDCWCHPNPDDEEPRIAIHNVEQ